MAAPHAEHGQVSKRRWQQLVEECREAVEAQTRIQWQLGDAAVEIEPIQTGGVSPHELEPGVAATLGVFAEEVGVELSALQHYRTTAAHWPKKRRRKHVSFSVHELLNGLPDRFEVIGDPPVGDDGRRRWTCEQARRRAGQQVHYPHEPDERLTQVRSLTREPQVASSAAEQLIAQPEVVEHLVADPDTWHTLSKARQQRDTEISHQARERTPAIAETERTQVVAELLGSCSQFVAALNRTVPHVHGKLDDADRETVHEALRRVRTAADWCQDVVDTGDTSLSDEVAAFLRGEES